MKFFFKYFKSNRKKQYSCFPIILLTSLFLNCLINRWELKNASKNNFALFEKFKSVPRVRTRASAPFMLAQTISSLTTGWKCHTPQPFYTRRLRGKCGRKRRGAMVYGGPVPKGSCSWRGGPRGAPVSGGPVLEIRL